MHSAQSSRLSSALPLVLPRSISRACKYRLSLINIMTVKFVRSLEQVGIKQNVGQRKMRLHSFKPA